MRGLRQALAVRADAGHIHNLVGGGAPRPALEGASGRGVRDQHADEDGDAEGRAEQGEQVPTDVASERAEPERRRRSHKSRSFAQTLSQAAPDTIVSRLAGARSTNNAAVLKAIGLGKRYERDGVAVDALRSVDLVIETGDFVAVMGPSGCGKSTLLHLLGGLDTPTTGDVELEGRSLGAMTDKERTLVRRHRVGFVFQFFNLVPVLTAGENVALPGVIDGMKPGAVESRQAEVVAELGLAGLAGELPSRLSGGQQQRVAIARALFHRPAVVLADEPTGNLDRRSGLEVIKVLQRANEAGQAVVLVTHDPGIAANARRVILLRDGEVADDLTARGPRALVRALAQLDDD